LGLKAGKSELLDGRPLLGINGVGGHVRESF
jgi:hypothetical protein